MEALANWAVGGLSAGGLTALVYILLTYFRSSKNDTVGVYSELYDKISERCDKCEQKLVEKEKSIAELKRRVGELETQLAEN